MFDYRIGNGYDVHKLVSGRKLILGGVEIPHETGLLGHSDADVVLHALMDAMLGAAARGDIGKHFPDTDDAYKDISSLELLRRVKDMLKQDGYVLANADMTIIAQAPKLAPYIPEMRANIVRTLGLPDCFINIKATTEEHLGFTGRMEGIAAHAVVLLKGPHIFVT